MTASARSQDVGTRRANGVLFEGNQEAEAQKADHSGQAFEPNTGKLLIRAETTSKPIL